jgi:ribonuclease HII
MKSQGGVDEAGRGCLIGALVVAGVSIEDSRVRSLRSLGVRDSKTLTPKRREELYEQILDLCNAVRVERIPPSEIDQVVRSGVKYKRLNYLEGIYFARVIDGLRVPKAIVDASDTSPERFKSVIVEHLRGKCRVISAHKADRDYPVVSAASIVAKVERDRAIAKLKRTLGDFGSGYPSDPVTRSFFLARMRKGEPLPPSVRTSWKTWNGFRQTLLTEA